MDTADAARELEVEARRATDRLRTLALVALAAPVEGHASRAEAARSVAQVLADASAELEGTGSRDLPRLADSSVADQVAVCAADLVAAVRAATPPQAAQEDRDPAGRGLAALRLLRRLL